MLYQCFLHKLANQIGTALLQFNLPALMRNKNHLFVCVYAASNTTNYSSIQDTNIRTGILARVSAGPTCIIQGSCMWISSEITMNKPFKPMRPGYLQLHAVPNTTVKSSTFASEVILRINLSPLFSSPALDAVPPWTPDFSGSLVQDVMEAVPLQPSVCGALFTVEIGCEWKAASAIFVQPCSLTRGCCGLNGK